MSTIEPAGGVLYVGQCAAASGGAERSLLELLAALPDSRHFATVALPPGGGLSAELEALNIPTVSLPMRSLNRSPNPFTQAKFLYSLCRVAPRLRSLARRQNLRMVHANGTIAAVYAAYAFGANGPPIVWHCRDLVDLRWLGGWLGRRIAVAIAISKPVQNHLLDTLEKEHIRLIRNGVDAERLARGASRQAVRDKWKIPHDTPLVGMAAHLAPWKRHDLFLDAVARLSTKIPEARFVVAGGTPNGAVFGYRDELQSTANRLGVAERTIFLDDWPDMGGFYRAIDILCHPSAHEPFGRVVAEAMMAGKPVLAVADAGPAELIDHGIDGLLARPGDAADLAENLANLLNDPERREKLAAAAAAKARREFAIASVAEQVGRLYAELGA